MVEQLSTEHVDNCRVCGAVLVVGDNWAVSDSLIAQYLCKLHKKDVNTRNNPKRPLWYAEAGSQRLYEDGTPEERAAVRDRVAAREKMGVVILQGTPRTSDIAVDAPQPAKSGRVRTLKHAKLETDFLKVARGRGERDRNVVGVRTDVLTQNPNGTYNLYELKTMDTAFDCIVEGLGQLAKYYHMLTERGLKVVRLVIVGRAALTAEALALCQQEGVDYEQVEAQ